MVVVFSVGLFIGQLWLLAQMRRIGHQAGASCRAAANQIKADIDRLACLRADLDRLRAELDLELAMARLPGSSSPSTRLH